MLKNSLLAVVVAATLFVPELALAQLTVEDRLAPGQPPVVDAYRALGGGAPGNSLAGIQYAIDRGIDMVEVDIQPIRDGQYILMYDPHLTDATNVADVFPEGAPSLAGSSRARRYLTDDYTLEEIAQLRLKDPEGGDHPVATLDAALDLAEGRLLVLLKLKRWDIDTLVPALERHDTGNILLFSHRSELSKLSDTAEAAGIGITTWLQFTDVERDFDKDLERFGSQLKMIFIKRILLTPELLAKAQEHGVAVAILGRGRDNEDGALWQGNSDPWLAAFDSGATVFLTSHPDTVLKLMGR